MLTGYRSPRNTENPPGHTGQQLELVLMGFPPEQRIFRKWYAWGLAVICVLGDFLLARIPIDTSVAGSTLVTYMSPKISSIVAFFLGGGLPPPPSVCSDTAGKVGSNGVLASTTADVPGCGWTWVYAGMPGSCFTVTASWILLISLVARLTRDAYTICLLSWVRVVRVLKRGSKADACHK